MQRITLQVPHDYTFQAGQYLTVEAPNRVFIPLSIASAPARLPQLELHYRSTPGLTEAYAMDQLLQGKELAISAASGDVIIAQQPVPLLIVAGGSGAAQAFSCAEHRQHFTHKSPTHILWCADTADDIYAESELQAFDAVELHVCVDDRRTPANEGLQWLRENAEVYLDWSIILAGSPAFVYTVTDLLLECGFAQQQLHSDVYAYAPR